MDTFEHYNPVFTVNGLAYQTVNIPVIEPCPFSLQMNEKSAYRDAEYYVEFSNIEGQFIQELETEHSGLFSSEAVLHFFFSDNKEIIIRPVGTPYLDVDIQYQELGIKYNPKIYADVSGEFPNTFEKCSMEGLGNNAAIKTLVVESFKVYSSEPLADAHDAKRKPACVVEIEGSLSFDRLSDFVYDHEESMKIRVYPDRLYQCIEIGPSEKKKEYYMEIE